MIKKQNERAAFMWLLLLIVIIIIVPVGLIWSLNTLFNTMIDYTFTNWLAALVLIFVARGGSSDT